MKVKFTRETFGEQIWFVLSPVRERRKDMVISSQCCVYVFFIHTKKKKPNATLEVVHSHFNLQGY